LLSGGTERKASRFNWNTLKGLGIGQCVSIVNATTYAMTNYLGKTTSTGTAIIQTVSIYWGLTCVLFFVSMKYGFSSLVTFFRSMKWYYPIALTICDISASLFLIVGIQMTNILSSQIISVCAIPFVMILSFFFLNRRFHFAQVLSALIASSGFVLIAIADGSDGSSGWVGDVFCLTATFLFSVANTMQEKTVNITSPFKSWNYVVILATCGPILSLPSLFLLFAFPIEGNLQAKEIGILCLYPILQVFIYSSIAFVIRFTSATFFNISNLTSSIFGLLYDIFLFDTYPTLLSVIGSLFVFISIVLFSFVELFVT